MPARPRPDTRGTRVRVDRFPCFDGIRAIAALMVIVYHAVFFATWFRTPAGTVLWNFNSGVWIFFVTSGFLLYRPFAAAHFDGPGVAVFPYAIRRAARIYPAYWALLAFFTFALPKAEIEGRVNGVLHVTLTQTYVHIKNPFLVGLPPAWSLVVEISFYCFLPIYAALIGIGGHRRRSLAVELSGVAALIAIGLSANAAIAAGFDPPWLEVLPQHIDAFALGMLLAVITTYEWKGTTAKRIESFGSRAWPWWTAAVVMLFSIPVVLRVRPFTTLTAAQEIGLHLCQTLLGFFVVVPAALGPQNRGTIRRTLRSRPVVYLGVISYGMYLWHWWLLRIVQDDWLGWQLQKANYLATLALALPLIVAVASLSWYCLERPIVGWARTLARRAQR